MPNIIHTKSHKIYLILAVITLIVAAAIYNICKIPLATHAEENTLTNGADKSFTVSSDRTITVAISTESIDLDLTPSAAGEFKSSPNPLSITVSTNNPTGYNLNMTTTTTNLTRTAPLSGQTPVIATLSSSGSFTADTFETNAWGFSLDGTTYQSVTLSRQIAQTIKESNNSSTSLTFGVKLNNEIPSGDYKTTLTFIATTNPLEASFDTAFDAAGKTQVSYNGQNYYKMQDMSGFICSMVAAPTDKTSAESTQLIDTRDNSVYWVSKLLDGNCWMTQNLDLNLDSSVALTSADTDLHSVTSWTPLRSTFNSTTYNNTTSGASGGILTYNDGAQNSNFAHDWEWDNDTPLSVDPGYRYVVPKEMSGPNTNYYDNGDTFYYCANQDTTCGGNSENGHYTMGNFYSFAAATATNSVAGTIGHTVTESDTDYVMPDSICPKGWRLMVGNSNESKNEIDILLGSSNYNVITAFNFVGLNEIRQSPLYFVRTGTLDRGALNYAGVYSAVRTSTIAGVNVAYYMDFNSIAIARRRDNSRSYGLTVRCLARTDLTIEDATYLQDVTPEMRQNTAIGTTATLKDKRDNEEYTIGKLADGNVWLLDNLRLGAVALAEPLSTNNTNMSPSVNFTLPASGTANFDSTNGYTNAAINTSLANTDATYRTDYTGEVGKIGVFYNYCAASAGTICAASGSNNNNATYDICPAGWKLPAGDTDKGSYLYLYTNSTEGYNSNQANFTNAMRTPLSGRFSDGQTQEPTNGLFWSSTLSDSGDYMYSLIISASSVSPQISIYRYNGVPVRCILK